jgi:hypothetical protein
MDSRQDTLYDLPVWESDRTDIHNAGGNGLPEPRLPTSMSSSIILRHLLSSIAYQFCTAFELFVPFFVILTGESIRREYPVMLQNVYFLIVEHSFGRAARLCSLGMQAQHYSDVEFIIRSLCYRYPCIITLRVGSCSP